MASPDMAELVPDVEVDRVGLGIERIDNVGEENDEIPAEEAGRKGIEGAIAV